MQRAVRPAKPGGGREALPDDWRRNHRVAVLLRRGDLARLEALAMQWGIPVGTAAYRIVVDRLEAATSGRTVRGRVLVDDAGVRAAITP